MFFVFVFVYVHVPNCLFVYFTYMILWVHYTYLFMHDLLFSLGMLSWVFYGPHPSHSSGCCRYFLLHFWGCAHATSNSIPLMKFFMIFRTHITIHWSCFEVCIYLFPSPVVQNELTQLKFVRLGIQLPICWWWKTISIKIKNGFDDVNCYQFVGNSVTILNFVFCCIDMLWCWDHMPL
jgi:hypothetical protein